MLVWNVAVLIVQLVAVSVDLCLRSPRLCITKKFQVTNYANPVAAMYVHIFTATYPRRKFAMLMMP